MWPVCPWTSNQTVIMHVYMYICIYIYTYIFIYIYRYTHMHTYTYIYIYTHIHPSIHPSSVHPSMHACMHACMRACVHAYMHIYIYIYIERERSLYSYLPLRAFVDICLSLSLSLSLAVSPPLSCSLPFFSHIEEQVEHTTCRPANDILQAQPGSASYRSIAIRDWRQRSVGRGQQGERVGLSSWDWGLEGFRC